MCNRVETNVQIFKYFFGLQNMTFNIQTFVALGDWQIDSKLAH